MNLNSLANTPPWDWPAGAGKWLMQYLRDSRNSPSDRSEAAGLAGDLTVMNDEMADLLLSIVRNAAEPEEVRARAAIALGPTLETADEEGFDAEPPVGEATFGRIQETLRRVHEDESAPKEVRRRALEASVRAPQDWHQDAVRRAHASGDEEWRLTAAFCMRWVEGFDREILTLIDSQNPEIRYEAVCAAGNQGMEEAWPRIARLVRSDPKDRRLLFGAIEAAGWIGSGKAVEFLEEMAESGDEEIAEAAEEALTLVGGEEDEEEE